MSITPLFIVSLNTASRNYKAARQSINVSQGDANIFRSYCYTLCNRNYHSPIAHYERLCKYIRKYKCAEHILTIFHGKRINSLL